MEPKEKSKKRTDYLSREVINLTGGIPPMKPSFSQAAFKGLKEKFTLDTPKDTWIWTPFWNSARTDELQLSHWSKSSEINQDYPFSKFNVKIDLIQFTPEEYRQIPQPPNWTEEETHYLWNLCQEFDLRFIVIQDRYDTENWPDRSVEDLKERYYYLSSQVLKLRDIEDHSVLRTPYNANYERKRKSLLERYFLRTREQQDEEKALVEEAKKLSIRIKKEEKDLKNFERLMNSDCSEIELPEWNQGRKEPGKSPYLSSFYLSEPNFPARLQLKIETIMKDIGIQERPMPTFETIQLYEKLKKEILVLLNLQKYLIKKENEKKSIEEKLKDIRETSVKRTAGIYPVKNSNAPVNVQTTNKMLPGSRAVPVNKEVIGNINMMHNERRVARKPPNSMDSDEYREASTKKHKKTSEEVKFE